MERALRKLVRGDRCPNGREAAPLPEKVGKMGINPAQPWENHCDRKSRDHSGAAVTLNRGE